MPRPLALLAGFSLLLFSNASSRADEALATVDPLSEAIESLVPQLIADQQHERDSAQEGLLQLAGKSVPQCERVLDLLPEIDEQSPPALQSALEAIRGEIEVRIANSTAETSLVTMRVALTSLKDVRERIERQTGNRLIDFRRQFGQDAKPAEITLDFKGAPFWRVVDSFLDQSNLEVYPYSGEAALALVNRQEGTAPRLGAASYGGPFRFEATKISGTRDLRQPDQKGLNVEIEVSWEPRLRLIALSQPFDALLVTSKQGDWLAIRNPEQSFDVEVASGNQAVQMTIPLALPLRETTEIATLQGEMNALIAGRAAEFRFEELGQGELPRVQRRGKVTVTLTSLRKNGQIWELHMRLRLDQPQNALLSHRGWAFDNLTYLLDAGGQTIDHAGFETTHQSQSELGLAYLFDLPDGPKGLTWVYQTPTSIIRTPVAYELKELPLP